MVLAGIGAAMHFAVASAGVARGVSAAGALQPENRVPDRVSVPAVLVDRLADSILAVPANRVRAV